MNQARLLSLVSVFVLCACAGPKYTVDDGRKVDETLLNNIRAYGQGERALRPAIQRSAALKDAECDHQWELPFAVATSYGWEEGERVAWVRALGVDERLTVVGVSARSPLNLGDRIIDVDGHHSEDGNDMLEHLADARDKGKPFGLGLSNGRKLKVEPFEVCRGYARLAPPNTPKLQDYHWLLEMHPLEITQADLSDDEALWVVMWGQGLSEEGGLRMKTYHYGTKVVGTLYQLVTLATGLKGAAMAAEAAVNAAKSVASSVATDIVKQQIIEQGKSLAADKLRQGFQDAGTQLGRAGMMDGMQSAAANRGNLSGVSRIAATVFERADQWSFERMAKLGANPLAGFTLNQKLLERKLTANAFVFDADRLVAINNVAKAKGLEGEVLAILGGFKPEDLQVAMGAMPLASAPSAFSFESADDPGSQPFARGLVDAMLDMPAESAPRK